MMRFALSTVRPRRQVLVYGWPDTEGNAVCLLRYLSVDTTEERIVWLCNDPTSLPDRYSEWLTHVAVRSKHSLSGFWAYLRSDVVCFTHGLYSSLEPSRGRVFVNLWHGDGPKRTENSTFSARPAASAVVAGTRLWGEKKVVDFGMSPSQLLVVGNPRIDDLTEPLDAGQRAALERLFGERFILWMPTYRDSNGAGFQSWSDGERLSSAGHLAALGRSAQRAAEEHGVRVVVKPHPMDEDNYADVPGLETVDDVQLNEHGVSLYQLLGASLGLVTDYSSVWTDYLVLDRPILLFCPDYEEYSRHRGFNVPDLGAVAPGPLAISLDAFEEFVAEVAATGDADKVRRRQVADDIGCVTTPGAARRLWDAVSGLRVPSSSIGRRQPKPGA
jgi:CDP-glycerol glycerophosphotransferase